MVEGQLNPYLDASEERVRELLASNDPDSEGIRHNSYRLILEAMGNSERREVTSADDLKCLPLALWILRRMGESLLTSRVINHSRDLLEASLLGHRFANEEIPGYAGRYGVSMEYEDVISLFRLRLGEFVSLSSRLTGYKYRLIYQNLAHGQVHCERDVAVKIIREAFVRKAFSAYQDISVENSYSVTESISDRIDQIYEVFQKSGIKQEINLGEVDSTIFPPCIKEYITQMRDGVNLPQMARFTLVSFLHKVGMDNHGIIELFKTAPDFNERLTTYQVNHITGEISSTEYSPPKCTVLRSNHLCYWGEDPVCHSEWLKHPLQYYTYGKRKKSGKLPFNKLNKR